MLSMFSIAAFLWLPSASVDGSVYEASGAVVVAAAGVGVSGGAAAVVVMFVEGAGAAAAGAAGVCAAAGAGVEGTAAVDELAGAAFGFAAVSFRLCEGEQCTHLLQHADYEVLLLDLVRLYRVCILQNLA
jgi:hypothetical protein